MLAAHRRTTLLYTLVTEQQQSDTNASTHVDTECSMFDGHPRVYTRNSKFAKREDVVFEGDS